MIVFGAFLLTITTGVANFVLLSAVSSYYIESWSQKVSMPILVWGLTGLMFLLLFVLPAFIGTARYATRKSRGDVEVTFFRSVFVWLGIWNLVISAVFIIVLKPERTNELFSQKGTWLAENLFGASSPVVAAMAKLFNSNGETVGSRDEIVTVPGADSQTAEKRSSDPEHTQSEQAQSESKTAMIKIHGDQKSIDLGDFQKHNGTSPTISNRNENGSHDIQSQSGKAVSPYRTPKSHPTPLLQKQDVKNDQSEGILAKLWSWVTGGEVEKSKNALIEVLAANNTRGLAPYLTKESAAAMGLNWLKVVSGVSITLVEMNKDEQLEHQLNIIIEKYNLPLPGEWNDRSTMEALLVPNGRQFLIDVSDLFQELTTIPNTEAKTDNVFFGRIFTNSCFHQALQLEPEDFVDQLYIDKISSTVVHLMHPETDRYIEVRFEEDKWRVHLGEFNDLISIHIENE